jgi:hypothetical protein
MTDDRTATITDLTSGSESTLVSQIEDETARAKATDRANDPEDGGRGINPRTVQAKLRSSQAATTAAIGAGFEFTPEEMATQLRLCQDQLNELRQDLIKATRAQGLVQEPAPDSASRTQADAVKNMFVSTVTVIHADIKYLLTWQNKLNGAIQRYMTTEHLNKQQWDKLSQGH